MLIQDNALYLPVESSGLDLTPAEMGLTASELDLTPTELFLTMPDPAIPEWNFAADESFIRFHSKVWIGSYTG